MAAVLLYKVDGFLLAVKSIEKAYNLLVSYAFHGNIVFVKTHFQKLFHLIEKALFNHYVHPSVYSIIKFRTISCQSY